MFSVHFTGSGPPLLSSDEASRRRHVATSRPKTAHQSCRRSRDATWPLFRWWRGWPWQLAPLAPHQSGGRSRAVSSGHGGGEDQPAAAPVLLSGLPGQGVGARKWTAEECGRPDRGTRRTHAQSPRSTYPTVPPSACLVHEQQETPGTLPTTADQNYPQNVVQAERSMQLRSSLGLKVEKQHHTRHYRENKKKKRNRHSRGQPSKRQRETEITAEGKKRNPRIHNAGEQWPARPSWRPLRSLRARAHPLCPAACTPSPRRGALPPPPCARGAADVPPLGATAPRTG